MKFRKILLLGFTGQEMDKEHWSKMDSLTEKKISLTNEDPSIDKHLKDIDCLLVKLGVKVGQGLIDKAPSLKYIGIRGTGFGGIDVKYASSKRIAVCNIADYATEGVAEFTFGAVIEYLRELERAKKQARENNYLESTFTGTEIKGKIFGIIGLGHIGTRIAEIALGFGANVNYWSNHRKPFVEKKGVKYQKIENILRHSDFITLNVLLNTETKNILDKNRVAMIKKGCLLVNPSPMELVDLNAIVKRLKSGNLSFILDHSDEMTKEQLAKLKPFKNCVIYPPIAYTTKEATFLLKKIFVNNLENFLKGAPTNKLN